MKECGLMIGLIIVSDELVSLSKDLIETIEKEDKEYAFKKNHGYVERNVPASKFKNIIGLKSSDIGKIISK